MSPEVVERVVGEPGMSVQCSDKTGLEVSETRSDSSSRPQEHRRVPQEVKGTTSE